MWKWFYAQSLYLHNLFILPYFIFCRYIINVFIISTYILWTIVFCLLYLHDYTGLVTRDFRWKFHYVQTKIQCGIKWFTSSYLWNFCTYKFSCTALLFFWSAELLVLSINVINRIDNYYNLLNWINKRWWPLSTLAVTCFC
jgi:hypothetical protein